MSGELHIRATSGCYAVFRGPRRIGGLYHNRERAEANLDREKAAEQQRIRPCMCCQRDFLSEGIHNRMCSNCRNRSEGLV